MEISKGTLGIIAATCIVAGASGAYFSSRSEQPASPLTEPGLTASLEASSTPAPADLGAGSPAPALSPVTPAIEARPAAPAPSRGTATRPQPSASAARAVESEERQPENPPAHDDHSAVTPVEAARVPEVAAPVVPEPKYEDLVVPAQAVIGLQLETSVSSERARIEDDVIARVTRDVRVNDRVAIPAGAKAHGEVTLVERGGRLRERARLGVRFTSIVLADGTRVPIATETIFREGDSVTRENTTKIGGGAIGGAIIGGILGGAKGAAIGGSIGAGAGTAAVVADGRNAATLASGSPVTVRIEEPITVTVER